MYIKKSLILIYYDYGYVCFSMQLSVTTLLTSWRIFTSGWQVWGLSYAGSASYP